MSGSYFYHGGLNVSPGDSFLSPIVIDKPQPVFNLSVSVTLVRGVRSSMTRSDFENFLIPYINRIWYPASIQFYLRSWNEIPYNRNVHTRNFRALFGDDVNYGVNLDFTLEREAYFNVYIFPYHTTTLGVSMVRDTGRSINSYIGLFEEGEDRDLGRRVRWNLGHLGQTLAHELGHSLSLEHNLVRGYLMFYAQSGIWDPLPGMTDKLTQSEITAARASIGRMTQVPRQAPIIHVDSIGPFFDRTNPYINPEGDPCIIM